MELILLGIIIILIIDRYNIKKQNKKILKKYVRVKSIIDELPDMVCFKDETGRWVEGNKKLTQIFDNRDTVLGLTDEEIRKAFPEHEETLKVCRDTDKIAWSTKQITYVEESFKVKNNEYQTFEVIKTPLYYENNKKRGLVVIGRDITEKRKADRLEKEAKKAKRDMMELNQYNKIQTEFFANLSHEFRTPINLIMSSLRLIELIYEKEGLKAKCHKYTKIINQNCYRLMRLVNNLIDISKIDSGHIDGVFKNTNIVPLIEDIVLSTKTYVEESGLTIIFDTNVEEKITACDRDKIERVMLNLLSNAVKFTPKGGEIKVELTDKKEIIEISVTDTGIGIPLEKQTSVFKRFVQVDKSLSREKEGSGIGLSLVKSIIEMHYGNIRIDSGYKEGSKFIIELPYRLVNEDEERCEECLHERKVELSKIEFSDIYI